MSTRYVSRANKDLKFHDLHTSDPAATVDFSMCPPKSKQQIEEEDSDSSLSDAHPEEYLIDATESEDSDSKSEDKYLIAATESEDSDSESEESEEGLDRSGSTVTATTQSVFYPNKRKKGETNTCSEEYKTDCEANEPSTFQPTSNLPYQYVPWCSKSSVDIQGKESWIGSWSSEHGKEPEEDRKGYHYLNIYGFYKKETGVGGYGVILRDPCGKPVVASASVQQNGESYFYHVLDGVKDGLALALQHKKYDLKLLCNSRTLVVCLGHIFQQTDAGLSKASSRHAPYQCGACNTCLSWVIPLDRKRLEILFPLLREIIDARFKIMPKSRYFFVNYEGTCFNQAAYHLAKQLSKKMKTEGKPEMKEISRPIDFGEEIKSILFEDACVGSQRYSQQRYSKLVK